MAESSKTESKAGHYARLRERFLKGGLDGFHDYEVVELLLKLADPRPDHKPTAKALLKQFGSLGQVLDASPNLLKETKGVGDKNIFGLKLVQAVASRYLKEQLPGKDYVTSIEELLNFLKHHLKNRSREQFMLVLLNGRNRILDLVTLFEGSLTSSAVYPREVVKLILDRDAAAVVLVHNHPSGDPLPSQDDQHLTRRILAACKTVDVTLRDHLIIAGAEHFSFAENGML